jgi:membrane fusion protein (multidrug efflux system)
MTFRTTIIAIVAIAVAATGAYMWWGMGGKGGDGKPDRGSQPVLVTLTQARTQEFVDLIEAVGTAKANESIELTAKSTDTVARLNFTDGQKVAAGYVVAEMSSREQSADITAAEATLKEQEQTLQRTRKLLDSGFVTKASLDTARAARDSAAARVAATRSRMADRTIKTPFAGVLGLRRVSVGALVRPADVITTLDDISRIKVDFSVAETQLAGISKGQTVRASAAAFPTETFTGTVESIDTRIDPQSRTITVRAVFANDKGRLLPGMLMTIGIESNRRQSLAAAEQSLVPIETRQYVYVVDAQNKAERREVKTGARVPGHVEILEGLKEGDSIVLEGTLRMRPGATIKLAGTGEKAEGDGRKERGKKQP